MAYGSRFFTLTFKVSAFLLLFGLLPVVGSAQVPVPRGNRTLTVDITVPENGDYVGAFQTAKQSGMQDAVLHLSWPDIEAEPGQYSNVFLGAASQFYPAYQTSIDLVLSPISTNRKVVPADLMNVNFDDPLMIYRYFFALDYTLGQLQSAQVRSLVIGMEVDSYLGSDDVKWQQFETFYMYVSRYLHWKWPGIKVGVEATLKGLTDPTLQTRLLKLNQYSDAIAVSYYPVNGDFTVQDPTVVSSDFKALTAVYTDKPIRFFQLGYPSSPGVNSSEVLQDAFVREVFKAWDEYASQIDFITFTWLHDVPAPVVSQSLAFYGLQDDKFKDFLSSLGLRTYAGSGSNKLSFSTFQVEAKARGW